MRHGIGRDINLTIVQKVMANFGVLLALLAGKFVQIVFFGPLRPMEVEVSIVTSPLRSKSNKGAEIIR